MAYPGTPEYEIRYDPYTGRQYYVPKEPAAAGVGAAQKSDIVKVNGRGGAEAYRIAPNSSVLLLDSTAPILWLKTTDGAGYPTLDAYDIAPHVEPAQAGPDDRIEEIDHRLRKIENLLEVITGGKSDIAEAGTGAGE